MTHQPRPGLDETVAKLFRFQRFVSPKANLYQPYSLKLRRRLELHTPLRYALWISIEADQSITEFNECVEPVGLALTKGVTVQLRPGMVTRSKDGLVKVHTFSGNFDDDEDGTQASELQRAVRVGMPGVDPASLDAAAALAIQISDAWLAWCVARDLSHQVWTVATLRASPMRMENTERLLRYITRPGRPYAGALMERILAQLRTQRRMNIYELSRRFPTEDPEEVMAAVAELMITGAAWSDISWAPFTYASELSAYGPLAPEH